MELYLDSADLKEIEEAFELGFVKGLTTTPTFMHRHGVTDIDGLIVKLSKMVPILQIEALGRSSDEIVAEAHLQLELGLDPEKTVFKIPISLEGAKACKMLRDQDILVNVHLIYTLQQAYIALEAGANFVCPLVGRLQDQGHDALDVVDQIVTAVEAYGYDAKVMFSSVRHPEHVRNAINLGVHICTIPWKVMKLLTENAMTNLGTAQFFEHTKLMTTKVLDVMRPSNPTVTTEDSLTDALVKMTESGYGCVSVVNGTGKLIGAFTDGDLRRLIEKGGKDGLKKTMGEFEYKQPVTIDGNTLLNEATQMFHTTNVDNIIVLHDNEVVGILDIQDLN